jgi:hypothetical protein
VRGATPKGDRGGLTLEHRPILSIEHIRSAAYLARLAAEIERDEKAKTDSGDFVGHRAAVTGAIFACVAFLEATVNEVYADAADFDLSLLQRGMKEDELKLLVRIWTVRTTRRLPLFTKYDLALSVSGRNPIPRGKEPYLTVLLVQFLRNRLVHFSPDWTVVSSPEEIEPPDVEKRLRGRFPESPLARPIEALGGRAPAPFFPSRCLSHGCASWAVVGALAFADEFFNRLGVTPRYHDEKNRLTTQ